MVQPMSILHLRVVSLSRAKGANAVETAARYAAVVLREQHTSAVYDFSTMGDVVYREIIGPAHDAHAWWRDREALWNAAEMHDRRSNARVAREWQLGLPHELTSAGHIELARCWGRFVVERYGSVADLSIHAPPPEGDARNHYAKLLTSTRAITATGFGEKVGIERQNGDQSGPKELRFLHQRWKLMVERAMTRLLASASP
jgi:MobA/MobL family